MIDPTHTGPETPAAAQKPRKILRMVRNERMAGSVPLWETAAKSDRQLIAARLEEAQRPAVRGAQADSFTDPLSRVPHDPAQREAPRTFGFADFLDMINPLQHIPVVGTIYRELTGDTIHPFSQILGGGLFGGPLGVAGGLANAIAQEETGRDLTGNAVALMLNDPAAGSAPPAAPVVSAASPAMNPAPAAEDLPGGMLAVADLKAGFAAPRESTTRLPNGEIVFWKTS